MTGIKHVYSITWAAFKLRCVSQCLQEDFTQTISYSGAHNYTSQRFLSFEVDVSYGGMRNARTLSVILVTLSLFLSNLRTRLREMVVFRTFLSIFRLIILFVLKK